MPSYIFLDFALVMPSELCNIKNIWDTASVELSNFEFHACK